MSSSSSPLTYFTFGTINIFIPHRCAAAVAVDRIICVSNKREIFSNFFPFIECARCAHAVSLCLWFCFFFSSVCCLIKRPILKRIFWQLEIHTFCVSIHQKCINARVQQRLFNFTDFRFIELCGARMLILYIQNTRTVLTKCSFAYTIYTAAALRWWSSWFIPKIYNYYYLALGITRAYCFKLVNRFYFAVWLRCYSSEYNTGAYFTFCAYSYGIYIEIHLANYGQYLD